MKSTKKVLSAVLALCMIFSFMAVGFTAQAAAPSIQDTIDAAIRAGQTTLTFDRNEFPTRTVTLTEPLVINGDITVDFDNLTMYGAPGCEVIKINGGNVVLTNGIFIAKMPNYSGAQGLLKIIDSYAKPAVLVLNGNATLDSVVAVGAMLRVPTKKDASVPVGYGVDVYGSNGATLTAKNLIALGMYAINNKSNAAVTIEDGILFGIRRAVYSASSVTYAQGTTQYKTVDFIEDFLKDGVTMTAREKEYAEYATDRIGNGILCVADPVFSEPSSSYNKITDTLTVTAAADNTNVNADLANRYSYRYTPDTCTLNGQTADFVEQADGTFKAVFTGIAGGQEFDAKVNYNLSVKLGDDQKDVLVGILDKIDSLADQLPSILDKCFTEFDDTYEQLGTALELVWNGYNELKSQGGSTFLTSDLCAEFRQLFGQCFTLYGAKLDKDTFNYVKRSSTRLANMINNLRNEFGATLEDNGDGILDKFDVYYDTFKADLLAYDADGKVTGFNDVEAAAKYVGDNYLDMYQLVKDVQPVLVRLNEILTDPDSLLSEYTDSLSAYTGLLSTGSRYLDRAINYADNFLATNVKYNALVNEYGDEVGTQCGIYAKKALGILQNPNTYFELDVEGDYINVFDFNQDATITTPSDIEYCTVTVNVTGYGKASVGDEVFSAKRTFVVEKGSDFSVAPVEYAIDDSLFQSILYTQPNTQWKAVDSLNNFKVGSDITITLMFAATPTAIAETKHIVFVTDKTLNFAWIGDIEIADGDDFDIPEEPAFKDIEFKGWSFNKNCPASEALDASAMATAIENATGDQFVYAIYEAKTVVVIPTQTEAVTLKTEVDNADTHRVYFTITIAVPDGYNAVQAGILATKNAAFADNMTLDLIGQSGVACGYATTKGADGFISRNLVYNYGVKTASGTVYGVGYVVLKNIATNDVITVYTDVQNGTLTPIA